MTVARSPITVLGIASGVGGSEQNDPLLRPSPDVSSLTGMESKHFFVSPFSHRNAFALTASCRHSRDVIALL